MSRTAIFCLCGFLAACSSSGIAPTSGPSGVEQEKVGVLGDLPLPKGAKWDGDRTLIFGSGRNAIGRITFDVRLGESELFRFFQEKLGEAKWQPLSLVRGKQSILTFVREDRVLTIEISAGGLGGSRASMTLAPRGGEIAPPGPANAPR